MSSAFLGKVIDNYRIIENLGVGGMGVVYKAIHIKLDKFFALKVIAPGLIMNENFIERFQTEAKALAKFEDPNIVQIYDLRSLDDQWFIVMEFVDGINLQEKIKKDGAFKWQDTLPIIKQILTAIGHAHSSGIVHRDIKPSNVMLSKEGAVKVTDFGLAKDESSFTSTMTIASGGTLYYMSPEHIKGFTFTDKRSDIYSIGMTFYEMLTGRVPFKEITSDFELRETIVRKDYPPPTSFNKKIPKVLESIVMKSLAKDTNKRFQSVEDMLKAIQDFEANPLKKPIVTGSKKSRKKVEKSAEESALQFSGLSGKKGKGWRVFFSVAAVIAIILIWFAVNPTPAPEVVTEEPLIEEPVLSEGLLSVRSNPPQATVYINGDSIGTTPIQNFSLSDGEHSITLKKENYRSQDSTLITQAGNHHNITMNLNKLMEEEPDSSVQIVAPAEKSEFIESTLLVKSFPSSANLWINRQLQGQTPAKVRGLPPDNYLIMVEKEGYQNYDTTIYLKASSRKSIFAQLISKTGGLSITTEPSGARVLLDGTEIENQQTPLNLSNIPIGKHRLEIIKSGYFSVEEEFEVRPAQIKEMNCSL
ncbi:MAG: serine/threonine protein kinase, partial [Calditrichia bacterium]|nr:serine/threonine protein kinase [Calditrichia bacterium]